MHVDVRAKAFCRYIRPSQRLADDGIARRILERCLGIELEVELAPADQVCKRNTGAPGFWSHLATAGHEVLGLGVKTLRRDLDQRLARSCRRLPDLHAAALDSVRAGRAPLVRRERSIAFDEFDLVDLNTEFLSSDLRYGNPQPLAEIDLAAKHCHGAVAIYREERINFFSIESARCSVRTLGDGVRRQAGKREANRKRAALEDCAAGETPVFDGSVHVNLPALTPPSLRARPAHETRNGRDCRRAPSGCRIRSAFCLRIAERPHS